MPSSTAWSGTDSDPIGDIRRAMQIVASQAEQFRETFTSSPWAPPPQPVTVHELRTHNRRMLRDVKTGRVLLDSSERHAAQYPWCAMHALRGIRYRFRTEEATRGWLADSFDTNSYVVHCPVPLHQYEGGWTAVMPRPPEET
jgi:hypothetical protein